MAQSIATALYNAVSIRAGRLAREAAQIDQEPTLKNRQPPG
jgi:hypothetical protein